MFAAIQVLECKNHDAIQFPQCFNNSIFPYPSIAPEFPSKLQTKVSAANQMVFDVLLSFFQGEGGCSSQLHLIIYKESLTEATIAKESLTKATTAFRIKRF